MKKNSFRKIAAAVLALVLAGGVPALPSGQQLFDLSANVSAKKAAIEVGTAWYKGDTVDFGDYWYYMDDTDYTLVPAVDPSCTDEGNIEYYVDEEAEKYYIKDEDGNFVEIDLNEAIIPKSDHVYDNDGNCIYCGGHRSRLEPSSVNTSSGNSAAPAASGSSKNAGGSTEAVGSSESPVSAGGSSESGSSAGSTGSGSRKLTGKITAKYNAEDGTITLEWDNAKGASEYYVEGVNLRGGVRLGTVKAKKNAKTTSCTLNDAKPGRTYTFRVKANIKGYTTKINESYTITVDTSKK